MICDSHIHFLPKELAQHTKFYQGIWQDEESLDIYLKKIDMGHLVYVPSCAYERLTEDEIENIYNNYSLKLKDRFRDKLLISAYLNPDTSGESLERKIRCLKQAGFSSLSLASSYKGRFTIEWFKDVFGFAEKESLVVFIHPQIINPVGFERVKDPLLMPVLEYSFEQSMCLGLLMVENLLDFKKLKIIFSSLGGVVSFLQDRFDSIYFMLRKRNLVKDLSSSPTDILKRVWVDSAGVKSVSVIKLALDFFGRNKVLFASDYPANSSIEKTLESLSVLDFQEQSSILERNFQEVFNANIS